MARRRINDLLEPPDGPRSIFGPEDDNVVPGEVIVALEADAAAQVAISVPNLPARRDAGVTDLGVDDLTGVLASLDVVSVVKIHGPSPAVVENGIATASDLGLDSTLRIRYAAGEDPTAVAERLSGLDQVAWAEPNRWREASATTPNDPQFPAQWGLSRIGCPDAWDITTGSSSIVVAVVDTGVDLNHPELASLLVPGQDFVDFAPGSIPRPGWVFEGDFTGVDAIPQDEVGHGTHVAGTISCLSNNGTGVAGVNWNVRLMPVRVLARIRNTTTNAVSGSGSAANIAAGIRWAADNGARVINMSLGGYGDTIVEREAVAYAVAQGVVVVAAMGNDDVTTPSFPAAYPGVIAVAATDSVDHRASFSNRGAHVSISGPGVGVLSTYWDDTYASLSGTSMATPHVAGVAALVLSRNSALSPAQVGNILRSTAKPLRDAPGDLVPNDNYGYGLVQAAEAVRQAGPVVTSLQLTCRKSFVVLCQRSLITICNSIPLCFPTRVDCPSVHIICQKSLVTICVSRNVICPSLPPGCTDVRSLACPSRQICPSLPCGPGGPGGPGDPGGFAAGDAGDGWEGYDPYGYDPYGTEYE
jgi:subtilisin family serine protease